MRMHQFMNGAKTFETVFAFECLTAKSRVSSSLCELCLPLSVPGKIRPIFSFVCDSVDLRLSDDVEAY